MKVLCLLMLLIPAFIFGIKLSTGVLMGYDMESRTFSKFLVEDTSKIGGQTDYLNCYNLGAFFDATYLRFSFDFSRNFAWKISYQSNNVVYSETTNQPLSMSEYYTYDLTLIAKYPISFGDDSPLSIWPGIGAQFSFARYNLVTSSFTIDNSDYDAMNDLFLVVGFGADYYLNKNIFLTLNTYFDLNLTPMPETITTRSGFDYSAFAYKFGVSAGMGYTF